MNEEIKEIKDIVNALLCLTIRLEDYEDGCGVDYNTNPPLPSEKIPK